MAAWEREFSGDIHCARSAYEGSVAVAMPVGFAIKEAAQLLPETSSMRLLANCVGNLIFISGLVISPVSKGWDLYFQGLNSRTNSNIHNNPGQQG